MDQTKKLILQEIKRYGFEVMLQRWNFDNETSIQYKILFIENMVDYHRYYKTHKTKLKMYLQSLKSLKILKKEYEGL